jgi:hypothetical protein
VVEIRCIVAEHYGISMPLLPSPQITELLHYCDAINSEVPANGV